MVYATKYALTKGIEYMEVSETISKDMVKEIITWGRFFHKGDWFDNKEDAIKDAEKRRIKQLQSLEKQIKKIKALKFEIL